MSEIVEVKTPVNLPAVRMNFEQVLQSAIDNKIAPESLERMLAVYQSVKANEAREAFFRAMSEFKAECPPVVRRSENPQFKVTRNGVTRAARFASLEDIATTIRECLARHDLSYRWGDQSVSEGKMTLACIVSHVGGHSESSVVVMPVESRAGCSEQQKYGSASTYAQRYSLIQAFGLSQCDEDADGNAPEATTITVKQAETIQSYLAELSMPLARVLEFAGVSELGDVPAEKYPAIIKKFEATKREKAK